MKKNYELTNDDFKSGKYDESFKIVNFYQDSVSEYTPLKPHKLTKEHYNKIVTSTAQLPYIISKWQSTVGQNDSSVFVYASENINERTKIIKKNLEKRIYDFFYKKLNWEKIEKEIIALIATEGNAIVMLNIEGSVIVHSIFKFNVYYESNQKITRYVFLDKNGQETNLNNLKHGVDIFHIKDPIFSHFVIAPSRLDTVYDYLMLEQKGVKANINLFANGFLSNIFLKFDYDKLPTQAFDNTKDKNGKTWFEKLMDGVNDRFRSLTKLGRAGHIQGLDSVIEVGKNNKDTQFYELIKELTPERMAWAYSMTLADFGAGGNTTYNNASTFDDALYDKVGRPLERILDQCRNDFLAPIYNLYSLTSSIFISYNEPSDPNRLNEIKEWREDYKNGLITIDEFRDKRGLEIIDNSLLGNNLKVPDKNKTLENKNKTEFAQKKKTIIEEILENKEYTKFNNRIKKAIKTQIIKYAESLEKKDTVDKLVELDKLESFYSFSSFRDNLKKFAKIGFDDVIKDDRITYSINYADTTFGKYTDAVISIINSRIDALLNGTSEFASVDGETASIIQTILKNNIELGTKQIAVKILEKVEEISINRAELIAQMEVVNAVESTRNLIYQDNNFKYKRALNNAPITDQCQTNKQKGIVDINYVYEHKLGDGQYPPFHFRCKTSLVYSEDKEDLK
jgi:hypothetical protein